MRYGRTLKTVNIGFGAKLTVCWMYTGEERRGEETVLKYHRALTQLT